MIGFELLPLQLLSNTIVSSPRTHCTCRLRTPKPHNSGVVLLVTADDDALAWHTLQFPTDHDETVSGQGNELHGLTVSGSGSPAFRHSCDDTTSLLPEVTFACKHCGGAETEMPCAPESVDPDELVF